MLGEESFEEKFKKAHADLVAAAYSAWDQEYQKRMQAEQEFIDKIRELRTFAEKEILENMERMKKNALMHFPYRVFSEKPIRVPVSRFFNMNVPGLSGVETEVIKEKIDESMKHVFKGLYHKSHWVDKQLVLEFIVGFEE